MNKVNRILQELSFNINFYETSLKQQQDYLSL